MDCLLQDNVSLEDRYALVDTEDGKETNKRMFLSPYVDDAWTEQCAHVHIYTDGIFPQNHEVATVNVAIETISHSKIIKVLGDADGRDINPLLPPPNPNDSDKQGEPVVLYKNRETVLLKSMIAELNGLYLDGVGYFQFNQKQTLITTRNKSYGTEGRISVTSPKWRCGYRVCPKDRTTIFKDSNSWRRAQYIKNCRNIRMRRRIEWTDMGV